MNQTHCDGLTILSVLKNTTKKHGLRKWCREHDLDPGNVSNIINLKKPMQRKVANALGFIPVTYYRRMEIRKEIDK